jgi:hypothetical protein
MKKKKFSLIKTPWYMGKGIGYFVRGLRGKELLREVKPASSKFFAEYEKFLLVHPLTGNFDSWLEEVEKSESKIGIILGARGTGKTAFGMKFLENIHSQNKTKCFAIGFKENQLPEWINNVDDISDIENNSFVLIDEGGILFNSRDSMTKPNKLLSDLILIARHKSLNILFITQNSSNLDVNILRQADFLILKPSSLLQKNFERKIIQKIYEDVEDHFTKLKNESGLTYVYSESFQGFIKNKLPSFWNTKISKSFRDLEK